MFYNEYTPKIKRVGKGQMRDTHDKPKTIAQVLRTTPDSVRSVALKKGLTVSSDKSQVRTIHPGKKA